ncbi:hypothetical protein ABFY45_21675 [Bacillus spizizenii]
MFNIVDQEGTGSRRADSDKDGKVKASGLAPGRYALLKRKRHLAMC